MEGNRTTRTEWFRTSVILRMILDNFSNREILAFSLVNKEWNFEAKSLLKARGQTSVRIGTIKLEELVHSVESISEALREQTSRLEAILPKEAVVEFRPPLFRNIEAHACEDVISFATLIEDKYVIPFSKLNFQIKINHPGRCVPFNEAAARSIIEKVSLTSLGFTVLQTADHTKEKHYCNVLHFLELVLRANAYRLCEIFIAAPTELNLHPNELFSTCTFDQLRLLAFDIFCDLPDRPTKFELNFLKAIVERAPNLQYLDLQQSLQIHPRDIENDVSYNFAEKIFECVLDGTKVMLLVGQDPLDAWKLSKDHLRRLACRYFDDLPTSAEIAELDSRTVLLKNSHRMLSVADLDILSLTRILRNRIQFLEMRELSFEYNMLHLCDKSPVLRDAILNARSWHKCFPNLQKLTIYGTDNEHRTDVLNRLTSELSEPQPDDLELEVEDGDRRLNDVQELQLLESPDLDSREVEFLCKLCPNVTRFCGKFTPDLTQLWSKLTRIELMELDTTDVENDRLEWILCGVFPEEIKELRTKNVKFLNKVHIVPIQTPISYLKRKQNLTHLTFHFLEKSQAQTLWDVLWNQIPCSRFSKVSVGLCFSRMPNLSISVRLENPNPRFSNAVEHGFESILNDFPQLHLEAQRVYKCEDEDGD